MMIEKLGCFIFVFVFFIIIANTLFTTKINIPTKNGQVAKQENIKQDEENNEDIKNIWIIIEQVIAIAKEERHRKTDFTSNDLANVFLETIESDKISSNGVSIKDTGKLIFTGNGSCKKENECYIKIKNKDNKEITDIPIYATNDGYITLKKK